MNPFVRVENDILNDAPIASTLQKVVLLAGRLNAPGLRGWAEAELNGYSQGSDLPEYRTVRAALRFDTLIAATSMTGQGMTPGEASSSVRRYLGDAGMEGFRSADVDLDDLSTFSSVELRDSIATLNEYGKGSKSPQLHTPVTELLKSAWLKDLTALNGWQPSMLSVYFVIPPPTFVGVVDRVRTALSGYLADLRHHLDDPARDDPDPGALRAAADHVQLELHGNNNFVTIAGPGATINVQSGDRHQLEQVLRDTIGLPAEAIEEVLVALDRDDPKAARGVVGRIKDGTLKFTGGLAVGTAAQVAGTAIAGAFGMI